jgi:hypothetical protein
MKEMPAVKSSLRKKNPIDIKNGPGFARQSDAWSRLPNKTTILADILAKYALASEADIPYPR